MQAVPEKAEGDAASTCTGPGRFRSLRPQDSVSLHEGYASTSQGPRMHWNTWHSAAVGLHLEMP